MATLQSKSEVYKEVEQYFGMIPEWVKLVPDTALASFWALERDLLLNESKIPGKYRELIGLAVAGATRCRYCALFHTEAARLNGASDDEIAEAAAIGGLSMFASTFLNAMQVDYDQFRKDTLASVAYAKKQMAQQQQKPPKGQAAHA